MASIPDVKRCISAALLLALFGQKLIMITMAQDTTASTAEEENLTSNASVTITPYSTLAWCFDLHAAGRDSDCPRYSHLCDDEIYYDLMTWQCPVTCRRCWALATTPRTGIFANGTCIDLKGPSGRSDCSKHSTLCRHARYSQVMAAECPRTCGYCPVNNRFFRPAMLKPRSFRKMLMSFLNGG